MKCQAGDGSAHGLHLAHYSAIGILHRKWNQSRVFSKKAVRIPLLVRPYNEYNSTVLSVIAPKLLILITF